ncbi:type I secretion system permease/ATPase [Photobacterium japonica]|uniref:type I secretion system permease/ATPase n=1 Tax=Photobacterium japonica TaxID=2910235 RepID=UPI003D148310
MKNDNHVSETLTDAVRLVTAYFNLAYSHELLVSGIPMPDGVFHYSQLPPAVKNLGLEAKLVPFNVDALIQLASPFIVINDNKGMVITQINKTEATCLTSHGQITMSVAALSQMTQQDVVVLKALPVIEERARVSDKPALTEHWFWGPILSAKRIYIDVFVASILINLFALATPLFTMNVYDRVVPNLAFDSLWVLAIGAVIVFVFDLILKLMRNWFVDLAGKKTDILMSADIYARTLGMKLKHRPESVGVYSRHLNEFESVRSFLASSTITALIDLPFAVFMLIVLTMIAGPLVIVPIVAMLIVALASFLVQAPLNRTIDESNQLSAQKNANLYESLHGIETVKLHGGEGQYQFKWEQSVGHMATWGNKTRWLSSAVLTFAGFAQQLVSVGLIVFGVYLLADNAISMGAIIASVMLSGRCLQPMLQLAGLATRYSQVITSYQQLNDIMATPQEQEPQRRYLHAEQLNGNVAFRNVSFRYDDDAPNILSNVSFSIAKGEKVAIIGRIGAGKTTVEKLLLNLYQPSKGMILLDDINIAQYNPSFVRKQIGVVPQDINLFYGSIRENIMLGEPAISASAVQRAAEMAGVTEFTRNDAEGLDRQVGEGGRYLSGGQRQSIALARAFLRTSSLYVLDEPTSQMDSRTENHVKQQLLGLADDQTLLLVTHKTSMLDVVNRVIVLDQGRVVLDGPRQQVLEALSEGRVRQPGRVHAA